VRVSPGIKNFDWYKAHVILRRMEVLVKAATIAKRRSTDAGFIGDDGSRPNWAVTRYHIWKDIASLRHGPFNILRMRGCGAKCIIPRKWHIMI
jgi:hypothetical protein